MDAPLHTLPFTPSHSHPPLHTLAGMPWTHLFTKVQARLPYRTLIILVVAINMSSILFIGLLFTKRARFGASARAGAAGDDSILALKHSLNDQHTSLLESGGGTGGRSGGGGSAARDEWESGDIHGGFDEEAREDAEADRLTGKLSIRRVVYVEEDDDAPEVADKKEDSATGGTATATTLAQSLDLVHSAPLLPAIYCL